MQFLSTRLTSTLFKDVSTYRFVKPEFICCCLYYLALVTSTCNNTQSVNLKLDILEAALRNRDIIVLTESWECRLNHTIQLYYKL